MTPAISFVFGPASAAQPQAASPRKQIPFPTLCFLPFYRRKALCKPVNPRISYRVNTSIRQIGVCRTVLEMLKNHCRGAIHGSPTVLTQCVRKSSNTNLSNDKVKWISTLCFIPKGFLNCQLLIVNYKHQFRDLLMNSQEPKLSFDISLIQYIIDV